MIRPLVCLVAQIALLSAGAMAQQTHRNRRRAGRHRFWRAGDHERPRGAGGQHDRHAKDHTAEVELERGGKVLVCATSGLHLTAGKNTPVNQPLMLALDRGAIEVQMAATASDVVLTPDLRFAVQGIRPARSAASSDKKRRYLR